LSGGGGGAVVNNTGNYKGGDGYKGQARITTFF
jgi:hypothetical protein